MTMSFGPRASFEYLPRVGLLGIRVRAGSIAEILRQAALSLSVVLLSEQPRSGPEVLRAIVLEAPDRAALLVGWLNELLAHARRDRWVPSRIEVHEATETHVCATAWGPVLKHALTLGDLVTRQGLRFDALCGGFEAEVLLDV
jgi:SHS2 domain-containing protein